MGKEEEKEDVKIESITDENPDIELKKGIDGLRKAVEKKNGEVTSEIKSMADKVFAETEKQQKAHDKAIADLKAEKQKSDEAVQSEIDEMKKKYGRAQLFGDGKPEDIERKKQMEPFLAYVKKGDAGLIGYKEITNGPKAFKDYEEKTYVIGTDTGAGYLIGPPVFAKEILDQAAREVTPALSLAKIVSIPGGQYEIPATTAHAVATRGSEVSTTTEDTTWAVGKEILRADYMTVLLKASRALIMDSTFNVESLMRDEVSGALGLLLGTEYCTGSAVDELEGITVNAAIVASNTVASGSASTITAGGTSSRGFNGLYWAPKTRYMSGASWLMRRATMCVAYGLVDGQGQYLLRFGLNQLEGKPIWSIMGSPVIECPDMPAIAGSAYPIAWGNFKVGYKIVQVEEMSILKDPYTSKTTNTIEYMHWFRIGGGVVIPEAIYLMVISAS